jgi:starvation-inducible DNA-binding protein
MAVLKIKPEKEQIETGLDAASRKKVADDLGQILGDTYLLLVKTHVYHWNVVGPLFLPLHELTEQHYQNLFQAADEIAERIRALGHLTPLSFTAMANSAELDEASKAATAEAMVNQLVHDHEEIVRSMRDIAKNAEGMGDLVTHDMIVGRMTFHEKAVWMLRAIVAE